MVSESEYRGNPLIVLKQANDDPQPFQFGVRKARLVLSHIEDIRRFVQKYERS